MFRFEAAMEPQPKKPRFNSKKAPFRHQKRLVEHFVPPNAPGRSTPKRAFELFDKHRGIMRYSYKINDSGSKCINMYLNIHDNFKPEITIATPGYIGTHFTPKQLGDFFDMREIISHFFEEEDAPGATKRFPSGVIVVTSRDFGYPVVKVATREPINDEDVKRTFVSLGKPTWEFLMDMERSIQYIVQLHTICKDPVRKMFASLLRLVRKETAADNGFALNMRTSLRGVELMHLDDKDFDQPLFNCHICLNEMKMYCVDMLRDECSNYDP